MPPDRQKPSKPSPDYPLTPHNRGGWCKKIGGKIYYFGAWGDPEGARQEYLKCRESLQAGIDPRKAKDGALTLDELCHLYLHNQKQRADASEIRQRTWRERRDLCRRLTEILGRTTTAASLKPDQFSRVRFSLQKTLGPVALRNAIVRIRMIFRWAVESEHLAAMPRFGPDFKAPGKSVIRANRNATPERSIGADDLRKLITAARQPLKAMILLGINGGLGNSDVASLTLAHVDGTAWLDFPRVKNAIPRRIPLWPETAEAITEAVQLRPASESGLLFVTRFGNPWTWENGDGKFNDEVGKQFRKLAKRLGIEAGFYHLRHTFRTVADATLDMGAVELIMGHAGDPRDMRTHYVERIDDERLLTVVNHVHRWLWPRQSQRQRPR